MYITIFFLCHTALDVVSLHFLLEDAVINTVCQISFLITTFEILRMTFHNLRMTSFFQNLSFFILFLVFLYKFLYNI